MHWPRPPQRRPRLSQEGAYNVSCAHGDDGAPLPLNGGGDARYKWSLGETQGHVADIFGMVDTLEGKVTGLDVKVTALDDKVTALADKMKVVLEKLEAAEKEKQKKKETKEKERKAKEKARRRMGRRSVRSISSQHSARAPRTPASSLFRRPQRRLTHRD